MLQDFYYALPIMLASLWSVGLILIEALAEKASLTKIAAQLGFILVLVFCFVVPNESHAVFYGMLKTGLFTNYTAGVFSLTGLLVVSISSEYLNDEDIHYGEFYPIVFLSVVGMMLMASSGNLTILFIGLELMSIALYVLAGLNRKLDRSNEAAIKYFLLGAFASGFFLYGIAFIYGDAGSLSLIKISSFYESHEPSGMFWIGLILVLIGLLFKIAAVPFHQWAPDAYEGAPTASTAFMSTSAKIASFSALIIIILTFASILAKTESFTNVLAIVAVLSMILGNLYALGQDNIKRMLAYSSIAHGGYMLVGIVAANASGLSGVLFYTLIYSITTIGAFGLILSLERKQSFLDINDYRGLFKTHPLPATLIAVFMFSLIGLPPLGGFIGKYLVFSAAIEADLTWLVVVGVLASLLSVFYYLRVVLVMFLEHPNDNVQVTEIASLNTVLLILALLTLVLGFYPSPLINIAQKAIAMF